MKTNIILTIICLSLSATTAFTQTEKGEEQIQQKLKTEQFAVYGNCGMCEKRIEGSLEKAKGVESADWDAETQTLQVTFDESLITLDEISKKVAAAGHDSEYCMAKDEDYEKLHGCCQYERPEKKEKK